MSEKNKIIKAKNLGNFNIGVVIFLIIIIYVLFNLFSYFTKTHIAEYQVQEGTIASNYIYQGIIVRDETIEYAEQSGYINYYVKNASKVSVTDVIYSIDTVGSISKQISETSIATDSLSSDTLSSISNEINKFASDYNGNDFSETYTFFNNINTEIAQNVNSNALADLSEKVEKAEDKNTFFQMTSPEDGIIVYEVDGFENYTVEDITSSEFDYNQYNEEYLFSRTEVIVGDPVYKRVNSENWNVIVPISETLAEELSKKSAVTVRFCKDDFQIDTACSVIKGTENSYYLNLSFNKAMIRYINDRFIDIELILSEEAGLKIPQSAITTKEFFTVPKSYFTIGGDSTNPGLLIRKTVDGVDTMELITPTLYYETEEYYYIDSEDVSEGDVVLMADSSSTYVIGTDKNSLVGVYNINKGYAVFKQINIIYENEQYAIVETKTAYGISLYDHIALDASKVKENQLTSK